MVSYKRKTYVKDLVQSYSILNNYNLIEFESIDNFVESIDKDLFVFSEEYYRLVINFNNNDELLKFITIFKQVDKDDANGFYVKLNYNVDEQTNKLLKEINNKNFFVLIDQSILIKSFNFIKDYNLVINVVIKYESYVKDLNLISYTRATYDLKKFNISIDYVSFEEMKIGEIHKLIFFLDQIQINKNIFNKSKSLFKEIFISNDLKLYPNAEAYKDNHMIFDIKKYYNVDCNNIDYSILNLYIKYKDVPNEYFENYAGNIRLINLYQNFKIFDTYIQVPFIAEIFLRRLT